MASTFEVYNLRSGQSTPQGTPGRGRVRIAGQWFSQPRPYVQKAGIRAYQQAPIHLGMMHPPQSETVRRDLLEYLEANGITNPQPRIPVSPSAPDLRPRAVPRWRPSGLTPVRQPSLGLLPPDPHPRSSHKPRKPAMPARPAPKVLHLRQPNETVDVTRFIGASRRFLSLRACVCIYIYIICIYSVCV